MGKGDKRGVTQRSDGGEFVFSSTILSVEGKCRVVIHVKKLNIFIDNRNVNIVGKQ